MRISRIVALTCILVLMMWIECAADAGLLNLRAQLDALYADKNHDFQCSAVASDKIGLLRFGGVDGAGRRALTFSIYDMDGKWRNEYIVSVGQTAAAKSPSFVVEPKGNIHIFWIGMDERSQPRGFGCVIDFSGKVLVEPALLGRQKRCFPLGGPLIAAIGGDRIYGICDGFLGYLGYCAAYSTVVIMDLNHEVIEIRSVTGFHMTRKDSLAVDSKGKAHVIHEVFDPTVRPVKSVLVHSIVDAQGSLDRTIPVVTVPTLGDDGGPYKQIVLGDKGTAEIYYTKAAGFNTDSRRAVWEMGFAKNQTNDVAAGQAMPLLLVNTYGDTFIVQNNGTKVSWIGSAMKPKD